MANPKGNSSKDKTLKDQADELLAKAEGLISEVENAQIFSAEGQEVREFPSFDASELTVGKTLGTGGFCVVAEVTKIEPDNEPTEETADSELTDAPSTTDAEQAVADFYTETAPDPEHYGVATAKQHMAARCTRYGHARYAIKKLRNDLNELEHVRAIIDLAFEMKYLSTIWHPNIVKMRAISAGPIISPSTFIVMDRLYGTLDQKIEEWGQRKAENKGSCCGFGANQSVLDEMYKDRLLVAYDLGSALAYLHKQQLLYRDLKPENIGFDIRGDVKLFDFGLAKSLEKKNKVKGGYGYNLTARTGSVPYMAPEIAKCEPYDKQADVFSFAILVWEIICLTWAFNGFTKNDYYVQVVCQKLRPPLRNGKEWPIMLRTVIKESWDDDPQKRPTIRRVAMLIRGQLSDMTNDEDVINRTYHMQSRSTHSLHGNLNEM